MVLPADGPETPARPAIALGLQQLDRPSAKTSASMTEC
jgi:hypothetical protein